jgi:hypothetical protein
MLFFEMYSANKDHYPSLFCGQAFFLCKIMAVLLDKAPLEVVSLQNKVELELDFAQRITILKDFARHRPVINPN